jgi:hypothetical protein
LVLSQRLSFPKHLRFHAVAIRIVSLSDDFPASFALDDGLSLLKGGPPFDLGDFWAAYWGTSAVARYAAVELTIFAYGAERGFGAEPQWLVQRAGMVDLALALLGVTRYDEQSSFIFGVLLCRMEAS